MDKWTIIGIKGISRTNGGEQNGRKLGGDKWTNELGEDKWAAGGTDGHKIEGINLE